MGNPKLRIGLLSDGADLDAWALRMVDLIRSGDFAQVVVVVRGAPPDGDGWARGPVAAGLALAERLLVGKPGVIPDAFAKAASATALSGIPVVAADDLDALRTCELDVIVRVNRVQPAPALCDVPRHGVWALEADDGAAAPPGYRETMASLPVTATGARILASSRAPERILYRSFSSTKRWSLPDNRSNSYWKALHFIPRKLAELQRDGAAAFFARLETENATHAAVRVARPGSGERLQLVLKKFRERARRELGDRRWLQQWIVLFRIGAAGAENIGTDLGAGLARFSRMVPPRDRFWADPFVVARDGKFFIFLEELPYATNRGHIAVIEMDAAGNHGAPRRVLERPYHLSYPFIFEFGGMLYMIPESGEHRTVELYRCAEFPLRWEFVKNVFEGRKIVDTTLLERGGRWWLFANVVDTAGASTWDELHVYFADSPLADDWTPHPLNPVVSDVRSSRPAGRFFERDGRLWRPSQNSSHHYGYGFNLCEVTELSETAYAEQVRVRVEPDWSPDIVSTHTFNFAGGLTVVDAQLRRRR